MPIPLPTGEEVTEEQRRIFNDIPDFIDDPLDPVVQDNIDLDIVIGQHGNDPLQPGDKPSEGLPYKATELEVNLTTGSQSNYAIGRLIPDGHSTIPDEGNPISRGDNPDIITIDVENSLSEKRPDTDEEITRIFTGVISNSSRLQGNFVEFMAFWPGFNFIQNGKLDFQVTPSQTETFEYGGQSFTYPSYDNALKPADFVARQITEKLREETRFPANSAIPLGPFNIGGTEYSVNERISVLGGEVPITSGEPSEGLLTRLVNATNSVWTVDRYGEFFIGPPTPVEGFNRYPTTVNSHKLRYITDTSAGKQSPAYRSVAVIGSGVVSQDGWGASAQIGENTEEFRETVTDALNPEGPDEDLAEPTFTYTNMEINTASEAENVMEKLKEKIREQMSGGEITVVGHPEVWPGDAIEMPDSEDQPFGLERYGVRKVVHRINNSDGFITKITAAGQTNANETVFSDDIEPPDNPGRYANRFGPLPE